ncbi:hypothetical protein, partial [Streptomyces caniscabiei]|uniref:hypothetical protein n=1 Tax=Streptomyces caniscabiei TaxID=2746961 RepID=UPI0038F6EB69
LPSKFEGKKKGQLLTLVTNSEGNKRAAFKDMDIRKQSRFQCRWADYSNMRAVREGVAEGEREAPALPSHIASVETIGRIKFWRGKNGEFYLP